MLTNLSKTILQFPHPRVIKIAVLSGLLSILVMIVLSGVFSGVLYWGIAAIAFGDIPWIGGWLITLIIGNWVLASSVVFFLFFFPYILLGVTAFFQDRIIVLVEDQHYPNLPGPMNHRVRDEVVLQLKFFGRVLLINLVFSPLYLILMFTAFGVVLLSTLINGYLIGIEYYSMVSLRRLTPSQHKVGLCKHRVMIHLYGVVIYLSMLVPFLNLLVPVLGCMLMTHLFYRHHQQSSFMTSAQE
ncbi:MAG: EI24 domain-containing protein [Alphaproteobacteria bacterium]|nr:EI24 domain-containing protein [Alphaproteobacteria bacterium]